MAMQSIEQLRYYAGWADKIYGEGLTALGHISHARNMLKASTKYSIRCQSLIVCMQARQYQQTASCTCIP